MDNLKIPIKDYARKHISVSAESLDNAGYPSAYRSLDSSVEDVVSWCNDVHSYNYLTNGLRFWFDTEEDATLFILAWG